MNNIYNDKKFLELLDKYSESPDFKLGKVLESIASNTDNSEMIVPVLGMQGMGKSTLINAVLGENILPNDADETTCVPVEVKYGENEEATVFFRNGKESVKAYTREDLNCYVDNNENPANEKQVSHIVLYRKNDLLKNGLTIVDLPGVGSITKENEETTMRYINNLCSAIFVIPTVPTIRNKEAVFVKCVWSQFSKAIFVQNVWGETEREVNEAVEYNSLRLKQIADSIGNREYDGEIVLVNAYDALVGTIQKDEKLISSSRINDLITRIKNISQNWKKQLSQSVKLRCMEFVHLARKELLRRQAQLQMENEAYRASLMKDYEIYREGTVKLKKLISETDDYLSSEESSMNLFIKENAKKTAEKIRSEMYKLINDNIFDGDELTQAFSNIQEDCCSEFTDKCFDKFMEIKNELELRMEQLQNVIEEENSIRITASEIYRDKQFKFEKSFSILGNLAGAVGGVMLFGNVSAGITKLLINIVSFANPIGLAVGVLTSVALTAFGGLIGNLFANGVRSKRAAETKRVLDPKIDELEKAMRKEVTNGFKKMCEQVREQLSMLSEKREKEEKRLLDRTNESATVNLDAAELEADNAYLIEKEGELKIV